MSTSTFPLGFASGGARGELHPFLLNESSFQKATNVRLHKRMARTAHGWEAVPVAGNDEDLILWRSGNTQGAWYFNPASGQSAIRFAEESAQILHSVAGQLFRLIPTRRDGRLSTIWLIPNRCNRSRTFRPGRRSRQCALQGVFSRQQSMTL